MAEQSPETTSVSVKVEPKITVLPPDTAKESEDRKFSDKVWQTHAKQAKDIEVGHPLGPRVSLGGKIPNRKVRP